MILFIKHVEIEGPETLGTFFEEKGYQIGVVNLHNGDRLPEDPGRLDAIIPLGGPMNVYEEDRFPFLIEENVFLKKALAKGVPILGICLGAQLLSKAAGGKVVRSPNEEIGWSTVAFTPEGKWDPLFAGLASPLEVYQWHGDMCVPPDGASVLASSAGCPVQAFRVGTNAFGLQFHAEITDKSIKDWTADFPREKQPQRQAMLDRYAMIKDAFAGNGRRICENFLKGMRAR